MKWTGISSFGIRRRHGFTLVEIAIVLVVGGLVIGSVWSIAAKTWENVRQEQLKEQIFLVTKNIRALYMGQNGISGVLDILTPQVAVQGAIPGDMIRGAAPCTNNFNGIVQCADHPWGSMGAGANGSFRVCAWNAAAAPPNNCTAANVQFFAIRLTGLNQDRCINAAMRNSGSDAPPGLINVLINNASVVPTPVQLSTAQAQCNANSTIDFVYRLVPPPS